MDRLQRRTWAEISLDNLEFNFNQIRSLLPEGCKCVGTVKADAYGHGCKHVAQMLENAGADYFTVACIDEAVQLRKVTKLPILILGCTPAECTPELIENGITQTVNCAETARQFSEAAQKLGKTLKVHFAVDSGMGRVGFNGRGENNPAAEIAAAYALPGLDVEGIFTHFAVSDVPGDENAAFTKKQYDNFEGLIIKLEREFSVKFALRHCANSGALLNWKYTYSGVMNMVRPGIVLYGIYPDAETDALELKQVMQLKTRIAQLQTMEAGATVSYGRTWQSSEDRKIAVLPIGYADGLYRTLSNRHKVLLRGQEVPLVGRICMDMCMADVTEVRGAQVGDIVTVFGNDGDTHIPVKRLADIAGTIPYELVCAVSPRVPRLYFYHGQRI